MGEDYPIETVFTVQSHMRVEQDGLIVDTFVLGGMKDSTGNERASLSIRQPDPETSGMLSRLLDSGGTLYAVFHPVEPIIATGSPE